MAPRETLSVRPSSFDLMPDEAIPALQRSFDEIVERRCTLSGLLPVLNAQLADVGVRPVSLSALGRWAIAIRKGWVRRPSLIGSNARPPAQRHQHLPSASELRSLAAECLRLADLREAMESADICQPHDAAIDDAGSRRV